jgi:hypothetical protein
LLLESGNSHLDGIRGLFLLDSLYCRVALGRDLARVSSSIAAALLLPLIVLAGDGGGILAEESGVFFPTPTFCPTTSFFGGKGTIEDVVNIFDFTDAIDGECFSTAGANFPDSGVLVLVVVVDNSCFILGVMEVTEA